MDIKWTFTLVRAAFKTNATTITFYLNWILITWNYLSTLWIVNMERICKFPSFFNIIFWRCTKVLSKFQLVFCCILTKLTILWNPKSNRKLQYSFLQALKNIFYLFVFQKLRLKPKKSREEKLFGILFILLLSRIKIPLLSLNNHWSGSKPPKHIARNKFFSWKKSLFFSCCGKKEKNEGKLCIQKKEFWSFY